MRTVKFNPSSAAQPEVRMKRMVWKKKNKSENHKNGRKKFIHSEIYYLSKNNVNHWIYFYIFVCPCFLYKTEYTIAPYSYIFLFILYRCIFHYLES